MAKLKKNEDGYDVFMDGTDVLMGTLKRTDTPEEAPAPEKGAKDAKLDKAAQSRDADTGIAPAEVSEPEFDLSDEVGKWEASCSRGGHRLFEDTQAKAVKSLERHFINGHTSGVYYDA